MPNTFFLIRGTTISIGRRDLTMTKPVVEVPELKVVSGPLEDDQWNPVSVVGSGTMLNFTSIGDEFANCWARA